MTCRSGMSCWPGSSRRSTGLRPPRDGNGFSGRLHRILLDQVAANVIEIEASEHLISRTAEHVKAPAAPYYVVHFQLRGSSLFRQHGLASALRAGDYVVTSGADPYSWEFRGDFSTFSIRFPQSFVDLPEAALRTVLGRPVPAVSRFGSRLSPFVAAVTADDGLLWGPLGARVARNLIDLFATALCEAVSESTTPPFGAFLHEDHRLHRPSPARARARYREHRACAPPVLAAPAGGVRRAGDDGHRLDQGAAAHRLPPRPGRPRPARPADRRHRGALGVP